jgi:hypothetical protein
MPPSLRRREREDLAAGGGAGEVSGTSTPGSEAPGAAATPPGGTPGRDGGGGLLGAAGVASEVEKELEGRPFEKNMLEECRSVDEYEKLNRISGEA